MTALILGLLLIGSPQQATTAPAQTTDSCECEAQRPENLAVVNGATVPTRLIEDDTRTVVEPLLERLDEARESALQGVISNRLLEVEATRRGLSTTQLIQSEVIAKADEPTDEDLRVFYERNQSQMPEPYEVMKENLRQFIRGQRQQVEMTILTTDLRTAAKIEVLDYSPKAPTSNADLGRVLAIVNGSKVTLGDVEDALRNSTYAVRSQIFEVERAALDARIDELLIAQEAARRNVSVESLVEQEITPTVKKVDAFDASKFYNENKDKFGGRSFQEIRDELVLMLQNKAEFDAKAVFASKLRPAAKIDIALVEPAPPTFEIDVAGRPTLGADNAPVTVVVFTDFECAKCAATHQMFEDVARSYGTKVRFVARHFPLEQHVNAYRAAQAAEAAFEQGKFWEYTKLLYDNQKDLGDARLRELATAAGLDRKRFDADLESGKLVDLVNRDVSDGAKIGVVGTPSVYVNGRALSDDTAEGLRTAIDRALKARG